MFLTVHRQYADVWDSWARLVDYNWVGQLCYCRDRGKTNAVNTLTIRVAASASISASIFPGLGLNSFGFEAEADNSDEVRPHGGHPHPAH